MSSVWPEHYAHHAVDGIYSGNRYKVAATDSEPYPWIEIDLLDVYSIKGVKVCARTDRLPGIFWIITSN